MTDLLFVNANRSKRVIAAYPKPKKFDAKIGERVSFGFDPDVEWEIVGSYDDINDDGVDETIVKIKFIGRKDDKTWDAS